MKSVEGGVPEGALRLALQQIADLGQRYDDPAEAANAAAAIAGEALGEVSAVTRDELDPEKLEPFAPVPVCCVTDCKKKPDIIIELAYYCAEHGSEKLKEFRVYRRAGERLPRLRAYPPA